MAINKNSLFDLTLIGEVQSAGHLIDETIGLLHRQRFAYRIDGMFACLSLGMEKMLKLSIGLTRLADGHPWPSVREMKLDWRHDVRLMDAEVTNVISARADRAANPPMVLAGLRAVQADPYIAQIVEAMSYYARERRFHSLDYLAELGNSDEETAGWMEIESSRPSPRDLWWQHIEQPVGTPHLIAAAAHSNEYPSPWHRQTVGAVETSVRLWVEMHRMAWVQGALGPKAKAMAVPLASSLAPDD